MTVAEVQSSLVFFSNGLPGHLANSTLDGARDQLPNPLSPQRSFRHPGPEIVDRVRGQQRSVGLGGQAVRGSPLPNSRGVGQKASTLTGNILGVLCKCVPEHPISTQPEQYPPVPLFQTEPEPSRRVWLLAHRGEEADSRGGHKSKRACSLGH